MSLEVPGFGATARLFTTEVWHELTRLNGGAVRLGTLLKHLTPQHQLLLMQNPLAEQGRFEIVVPKPLYPNEIAEKQEEKVEKVRKKKLNPNAPAFKPNGFKE